MPLDGPLAPGKRESCFHGLVVPLKPLRIALQFSNPLLFDQLQPGVQLLALPLMKHGREALDELIRVRNLLVGLTEPSQIGFLPREPLLFLKRDLLSSHDTAAEHSGTLHSISG